MDRRSLSLIPMETRSCWDNAGKNLEQGGPTPHMQSNDHEWVSLETRQTESTGGPASQS